MTNSVPTKDQWYRMKSASKIDQILTDKEERRQVFQYQYVRKKIFQIFESVKDDEEGDSTSTA